jgi:anti-sigma regulatory factor (Ser/Thr protein kinase)
MTGLASCDTDLRKITIAPKPPPLIAWWIRHFRGSADQVPEVRHWLEDLLPDCAARADVLLLASELCTNAIVHTRSGEAGGQFSVDIDWAPTLARVVIGDQGSANAPAIASRSGDAGLLGESRRGLLLVDDVADNWGTASRPNRRWVWADVDWQARGGPLPTAPGGLDAAIVSNTMIRKAFPGTSIWWGHQTKAWWAAVPGSTNVHGLICAPTRDSLAQSLARTYPRVAGRGSTTQALPTTCCQPLTGSTATGLAASKLDRHGVEDRLDNRLDNLLAGQPDVEGRADVDLQLRLAAAESGEDADGDESPSSAPSAVVRGGFSPHRARRRRCGSGGPGRAHGEALRGALGSA